ncbi:putative Zn-dependent peptidase [Acanthamoeba polyphaga moumouvirus]|uniref:Putative Zn-dependent peptidase n=2 Tax=Moumouvirus TaxID=3080801 RepID=L7RBE7_9VIRU|nr:putative Zn-dependent peptidase [Acanthamoeba polyphaga moumouvirus]AGC01799.1 putative Zn-dependent peptidase [Acanthamoeba polyphaga moumouvirus]AQN68148.1 putative Zn-dependent peptidase [Saudi moumouvirus]
MEYHEKILSNGMKLVFIPNTKLPIISLGFFIKVGSRNEIKDNNGVAHFVEHMLFKSTKNRTANELYDQLDTLGATYNAGTTSDYTFYYFSGNSSDTLTLLEILFDIYKNPLFLESDILLEKKVIIEEMRVLSDSPIVMLQSQLHKKIFKNTSLEREIIGTENTIKNMTSNDLKNFYKCMYQPNNTIFIIVGNFNPAFIYNNIKNTLSQIPNIDYDSADCVTNYFYEKYIILNNMETQSEPYFYIKNIPDLKQIYIFLAFPLYDLYDEYSLEIDFISLILSGGSSSRLTKKLREDNGISYTIKSWPIIYEDSGVFVIQLIINPSELGKTFEILSKILTDIKKNKISDKELKKIVNLSKNELIYSMIQPLDILVYFGSNYMSDENFIFNLQEIYDNYQNVTSQDILDVCQKIFIYEKINLLMCGNINYSSEINDTLKF